MKICLKMSTYTDGRVEAKLRKVDGQVEEEGWPSCGRQMAKLKKTDGQVEEDGWLS
jgi:hypothetical protein